MNKMNQPSWEKITGKFRGCTSQNANRTGKTARAVTQISKA